MNIVEPYATLMDVPDRDAGFRTRLQDDLIKSKQLEKQLKAMAESYLEVDQL